MWKEQNPGSLIKNLKNHGSIKTGKVKAQKQLTFALRGTIANFEL